MTEIIATAAHPSIHWRCKLCYAQGGIDIQWPHRNDPPTLMDLRRTIDRIVNDHTGACAKGEPTYVDYTVEL